MSVKFILNYKQCVFSETKNSNFWQICIYVYTYVSIAKIKNKLRYAHCFTYKLDLDS